MYGKWVEALYSYDIDTWENHQESIKANTYTMPSPDAMRVGTSEALFLQVGLNIVIGHTQGCLVAEISVTNAKNVLDISEI